MPRRRVLETTDERTARLDRDRQRKRRRLEAESEDQRTERLLRERERRRRSRNPANHQGLALRYVDESETLEHYCGPMTAICTNCLSLNFDGEKPRDGKFTSCCHKGKVKLAPLTTYPSILKKLFCDQHEQSANFKDQIRCYNSALAFASMGAQVDQVAGRGPYCYKIHGQIYHRTSGLHPGDGEPRKYAQIYVLDPAAALAQRMGMRENGRCLAPLMDMLASLLREINPYAHAYKMMQDFEKEEIEKAEQEGRPVKEINMWIHQDKRKDKRRYNAPVSNEVAIVFRSEDGEPPFERDICVHPKNSAMHNISLLSQHCDPMTYPLLFPSGDRGWVKETKLIGNGKRENLTHLQYYAYRLAIRNEFNPILSAGKLFQQYIVDAYCKIEANRLNYHKQNQAKLRSDLYSGLMDHVNNLAAYEGTKPGTVCILPSSFQGSPRADQQNFQDAMAIVRKYGKPDLFVTFTCNPKWTEIKENLKPWECVENRPDLVSRVFQLKLKELLNDMLKKQILGFVIAYVYVIEFQKRGLPHSHILIVLKNEDKPRTKDMIDKIVCAEIPDLTVYPRLYEIVKSNMVHGPCGKFNQKSSCMSEKGECTKGYPKEFAPETRDNINGYPVYRRRNDGMSMNVGKYTVDNRWIVPFNKYLTLKYNAHVNVEVCASIKSVKYLFKYVYKGHDRANLKIQAGGGELSLDEPAMFLDSRYISAPEGIWRIRENKMHEQSHTIIRLAVHLPDQQKVVFQEGNELQALVDAEGRNTTLTAWFELNRTDTNARQYLYQDIPYHYIFNTPKNKNCWSTRKRGHDKVISRMYSVSPSDMERYYLRILLLHVKGAQSFNDVRTVDGKVCGTFREAARVRNILKDDTEWDRCLTEATLFQMPAKLRELFGVICAMCSPADPLTLWETHKEALTEDLVEKYSQEDAENMALDRIRQVLLIHGKSCADMGLPEPTRVSVEPEVDRVEEKRLGLELKAQLNAEQLNAFNQIMDAIENPDTQHKFFFLDGPGGSGKSFTYNAIIRTLRGKDVQIKSVALTGIAAELLIEGRTVHSTFGAPLKFTENSVSNVTAKSFKGKALRDAKLIIWDECTMASGYLLKLVDTVLRDLMNTDEPFGGKVMLLGGHFCQILPVVRRGSREAIVGSSLRRSSLWHHFKRLSLNQNMRADPTEQEFARWTLRIGNGDLLNSANLPEDIVEIPDQCIVTSDIINEVFGKTIKQEQVDALSQRAILCPKNKDTATLNEAVLKRLVGEVKTYYSVDEINVTNDGDDINYPVEFLNSLTPAGMPPHELNLKIGAVIMLLRNLNTKSGLCNGTRLIVTKLHEHVIEARIITGKHSGDITFIPRVGLDTTDDSDLPFDMHRRQFPVRLAYAITINKAQGQTLEMVGIFLPEPVFAHGQLYVAFSRGKAFSKVRVKIIPGVTQGKLIPGSRKMYTQNIVYKEILECDPEHRDESFNETNIWDYLDVDGLGEETWQSMPDNDSDTAWSDYDLEGVEIDLADNYGKSERNHDYPSTSRGTGERHPPPSFVTLYPDSDSD